MRSKNPEIIPDEKPVVMPPEPEVVVYSKKEAKKDCC